MILRTSRNDRKTKILLKEGNGVGAGREKCPKNPRKKQLWSMDLRDKRGGFGVERWVFEVDDILFGRNHGHESSTTSWRQKNVGSCLAYRCTRPR